jgi:hypothetical protein
MSQVTEAELNNLFHQLQQTEIEDYDLESYEGLEADDAKLEWLKDLNDELQAVVESKEQETSGLESDVDNLSAVKDTLQTVAHKLKLSLVLEPVEG